ncbi:MAG: hypothetical protein HRU33_10465 [Rhodobacteraceae bacterium]|nr:hypothetical protein [Paracoccaceae bacterium]
MALLLAAGKLLALAAVGGAASDPIEGSKHWIGSIPEPQKQNHPRAKANGRFEDEEPPEPGSGAFAVS